MVISTRLARPISDLALASRRVASGDYGQHVAVGSGELGELAASFNDMAASLDATERRRHELIGDVAHELRTPIASLRGYIEGLDAGVFTPGPETWRILQDQASRLARLVDDLSDLWRAEANDIGLHPEDLDGPTLVHDAIERHRADAARRSIQLVAESGRPVRLRADPARIAQALDNLVGNALRYTAPGGRVEVSLAVRTDRGIISVRDTGPGLTPDQLAMVFERFYRVDPSRSRDAGGSGLGLAIAKALTEAMGGRISATSPAKAAAALPPPATLGPETAPPAPPPRPPKKKGGAGGRGGGGGGGGDWWTGLALEALLGDAGVMATSSLVRILVVDDEPPMVELVRGYLAREGWEVLTAGDGNEALEVARTEHPDVVVLDLMLPGLDGVEVCRQLRTFSDAYVVMLTAKSEEVDKLIGLAVGADDYLTKPFSPRELVARIKAILRRARSSAAGGARASRSTWPAASPGSMGRRSTSPAPSSTSSPRWPGSRASWSTARRCWRRSGAPATTTTISSTSTSRTSGANSATTRSSPASSKPCAASATAS